MAQPGPGDKAVSHQARIAQLERHYVRCFETEDGQQVLADLRQVCFVEQSTYVPGCTDAMLINEGLRRVWLHIEAMLKMKISEAYVKRDQKPATGT